MKRVISPPVRESLLVLSSALVLGMLLKVFVLDACRVETGSMENVLLPGDCVLVNKLLYGSRTPALFSGTWFALPSISFPSLVRPRRGDVMVFRLPGGRDDPHPAASLLFVKRCIGLPGDTVVLRQGMVFVNGRETGLRSLEPDSSLHPNHGWSDPRIFPQGAPFNGFEYGPFVVPWKGLRLPLTSQSVHAWETLIIREGHTVGIREDNIVLLDGVPAQSFAFERDYYFVLGDNLDHSLDSRFWGPVPDYSIVGKAFMVYWSQDDAHHSEVAHTTRNIRWGRIGTLVR